MLNIFTKVLFPVAFVGKTVYDQEMFRQIKSQTEINETFQSEHIEKVNALEMKVEKADKKVNEALMNTSILGCCIVALCMMRIH